MSVCLSPRRAAGRLPAADAVAVPGDAVQRHGLSERARPPLAGGGIHSRHGDRVSAQVEVLRFHRRLLVRPLHAALRRWRRRAAVSKLLPKWVPTAGRSSFNTSAQGNRFQCHRKLASLSRFQRRFLGGNSDNYCHFFGQQIDHSFVRIFSTGALCMKQQ